MFELGSAALGITFIILGIAFLVLTPFLLRAVPRLRPVTPKTLSLLEEETSSNENAILLVQPGGRVVHINQQARDWFQLLQREQPNLERLARRTRPADAFLKLCAAPGKARFTLQSTLVEAVSYAIPYQGEQALLVTMQQPELTGLKDDQDEIPAQTLTIFNDLSQAMTASLDLETTITNILESIDRLVPSDFSELTIWNIEDQGFKPYRYLLAQDGNRSLETSNDLYPADEGYTGYLFSTQKPLRLDDINAFQEASPLIDRQVHPFRSYLGIPLEFAGKIIGTIELTARAREAFTPSDMSVLKILAGHAAVALQNAIAHSSERKRVHELASLAELTKIGNSLSETSDLFGSLTSTISAMLDINYFGFLIYDPAESTLAAEVPFIGVSDQFAELYRTTVQESTPAEAVLYSQDIIITNDVENNRALKNLRLNHLAHSAGMAETVLIPLTSNRRMIGYMQVADKKDGSNFNDDDFRFLMILAGQAAPIIENANLISDSRRRTQRAESLRRIASLAGSSATLDEILKFSLLELSHFLQADQVALFFLDDTLGEFLLHAESIVGIPEEALADLSRIEFKDIDFSKTATSSTIPLITKDLSEEPLSPAYVLLKDFLPGIRSAMVVPLVIRERGIGEIFIGSVEKNFYTVHDLQSIGNSAGQLAGAIERSTLYAQTDEKLQRRVDQLTALTHIGRELNTTLEHEHLLQMVYDEALHTTKADGGTIFLFELQKGNGSSEQEIVMTLGQVPDQKLTPVEIETLSHAEPFTIDDYQGTGFLPPVDEARSSLIIPIAYQGQKAGLIHLYSLRPNHFDQVALDTTQALAIQAAIAIGNAQRYQNQMLRGQNLDRRVDSLAKLLETTHDINLEMPLEQSLRLIANGIQESNTFEIALIYLYETEYDVLKAFTAAGLPADILREIKDVYMPWSNIVPLIEEKYAQGGGSFFVPYEDRPDIPPLIPEYALLAYTVPDEGAVNIWQPGDRLLNPLYDSQGKPLGLIAVDAPRSGLRPDSIVLEALEIFSTQAALIIESSQKVYQLRSQVETIQAEIDRSASVTKGAQTHLSLMLNKDLEQTIAIQQLHDRAHSIRVGLEIAEAVNRQPDRSAVFNSLASQIIAQLDLDIALVAESSAGTPRIINEFGSMPEHANPSALLGQRNPIRSTIQSGDPLYISNIDEDMEWRNTPLLKNLNAKGFVTIPIATNGQVEATVLAVSQTPLPQFTQEDQQVYELIAGQVSITLQNLSLLTETRRRLREVDLLLEFSRQLGSLDSQEILTTLAESVRRVLSHAHGVMISLWDEAQESLVVTAASGYTDNDSITQIKYKFAEALPGQVYTQGIALNVSEIDFANQYNLSEENLLLYRQATGGRLPVSSLLVPIKSVGDNVLGVMSLDNFNTPAAFNDEDKALVTSLAQQTALTLDNARLFEEARRFNEELEQRVSARTEELAREHRFSQTMLQISSELASSLDLDMVLNRSLELLNEAMDSEQSTIVIVRPGQTDLINRAGAGIHKAPPTGGRESELKIGEGLAGWVIQYRRPVVIADLLDDDRWLKDYAQTSVYRSCLAVPLTVGAEALGALLLYHREADQFQPDQINAVQATANQFAVTINNGELFQLIRDQAENLGGMLRSQQVEASRSKAMLEGVADGVLVTDANNAITLFNDAAEQILEMERDAVIGHTLDDFVGLFGEAAQSWMETIQEWSANPQAVRQVSMYSERVVMEDGRVVSVHLAPVSDQSEFLGTISIFRDITHQVEVDRLKSEFVATVSHELRTPMTPIKGYVEFLLMGGAGDLNEQQTQFLDIIKSNIDRLSILVNDLLDVSRIEAGKVALSFQPMHITDVITEVTNDIQQKSVEDSKTVGFVIDAPEALPDVYGDQERVRQILNNLTENAFRYSPEGSMVTISVSEIEDYLQIDVTDQGIGIFPDEQERIFERFYRGENQMVMASAGTGLGLPIVKQLVEMHNGQIWVQSDGIPGQGSTFSFTLPTHVPDKENAAQILI